MPDPIGRLHPVRERGLRQGPTWPAGLAGLLACEGFQAETLRLLRSLALGTEREQRILGKNAEALLGAD
jgi:hypothetical protein